MSLQRQHFLLSYLKTLSVGPAGFRTHDLPHGSPVLNQPSQLVGSLTYFFACLFFAAQFGCLAWSVSEQSVLYVAEKKLPKAVSYFEKQKPGTVTVTYCAAHDQLRTVPANTKVFLCGLCLCWKNRS